MTNDGRRRRLVPNEARIRMLEERYRGCCVECGSKSCDHEAGTIGTVHPLTKRCPICAIVSPRGVVCVECLAERGRRGVVRRKCVECLVRRPIRSFRKVRRGSGARRKQCRGCER